METTQETLTHIVFQKEENCTLLCPRCDNPVKAMSEVYRRGQEDPQEKVAYCPKCKMKITLQVV